MAVGTTTNAAGATAALAEQWNGLSWRIVPTPPVPNSPYAVLSAVSCSAASACTAVGSTTAPGSGTLVERWNGSNWAFQTMAVPSDSQEGFATGVSCTSATTCVAVGDYINNSFTYVSLAEQWNGTSWTLQTTPNPTGAFLLQVTGLSCSTAGSCTAVGWTDAGALALRLHGGTWRLEPTPPPSGPPFVTPMLNAVSCASGAACLSVGSFAGTLAESWNGTAWALQSTPNAPGVLNSQLAAVSCGNPTSCVAVGTQQTAAGGQVSLAENWNGSLWRMQSTPSVAGALTIALNGVACTAATACTAVGWFDSAAGTQVPLAERWNGHVWSIQLMPVPSGAGQSSLSGVSCASAVMCVAVGSSRNAIGHQSPLVERWNGTVWTIATVPTPASSLQARLSAVSCASTTACVTVGEFLNGSILVGRGHAHQPMADVWNGVAWTAEAIDRPAGESASYLESVSCSTATSCAAVGWAAGPSKTTMAIAEHWNGSRWTLDPGPSVSSAVLAGVSCVTPAACIAVGSTRAGATIAEGWNGSVWTVQATPNRTASVRALTGVDCVSATSCTAVGSALGTAGYTVTLAERFSG